MIISLSSCAGNNQKLINFSSKVNNNNISSMINPLYKNTIDTSIDIDKLKVAIKMAINDDVWYYGQESSFNHFEEQTSNIEIFYCPPHIDDNSMLICVYIDRLLRAGGYNEGEMQYFCILMSKHKYGYDSEMVGYFERDTIDGIQKSIKEYNYVPYNLTSNITFDKVTQPTFSPMTNDKMKSIDDIENAVTDRLMQWPKTGKFRFYIRDFNEVNTQTYVVIQDDKGKMWVLEIAVIKYKLDNTGGKFLEVGKDASKYMANQYKKVSFERDISI